VKLGRRIGVKAEGDGRGGTELEEEEEKEEEAGSESLKGEERLSGVWFGSLSGAEEENGKGISFPDDSFACSRGAFSPPLSFAISHSTNTSSSSSSSPSSPLSRDSDCCTGSDKLPPSRHLSFPALSTNPSSKPIIPITSSLSPSDSSFMPSRISPRPCRRRWISDPIDATRRARMMSGMFEGEKREGRRRAISLRADGRARDREVGEGERWRERWGVERGGRE
jgi:hypothetical protein